jgi:hypothetical protein
MAVPEQTPYSEHTGNGVTKSFALNFYCESKDHLIVLVDEIEPPIATWSLSAGNVVFTTAPAFGSKITLQRNTPFGRTTDYQTFNNSFRPQSVNGDFDRLWLKLQELGVADWLMKLYVDRLHQQQEVKINELKNYVDDRDDELRSYLMEEIRKQGVALDQLDEYYNYLMQRLAQIAVDKGWDASFVVDGLQTQREINLYGGKKYDMPVGGYPVGAEVLLDNGDRVKSTISDNINNPNADMTGWVNPEAEQRYYNSSVTSVAKIKDSNTWQQNRDVIQAVNDTLYASSNGGKIQLPPGNFKLKGVILDPDVTVVGNNTWIEHPDGFDVDIFATRTFSTSSSIIKDAYTLTVADATGFRVGSLVGIECAGGLNVYQSTTLVNSVDASQTTGFQFADKKGFQSYSVRHGLLIVDNEVISYSSMDSNGVLGGVVRGLLGTTAAAHNAGAQIGISSRHVTEIINVSGNTITLLNKAKFTVTGANVLCGGQRTKVLDINVRGARQKNVSGHRWSPFRMTLHKFGEANYYVEDSENGVYLQNSCENKADIRAKDVSKTGTGKIGAAIWCYQGSHNNELNLKIVGDCWCGVLVDDRSNIATEWIDGCSGNHGAIVGNFNNYDPVTPLNTTLLNITACEGNNFTVKAYNIYAPTFVADDTQGISTVGAFRKAEGNEIDVYTDTCVNPVSAASVKNNIFKVVSKNAANPKPLIGNGNLLAISNYQSTNGMGFKLVDGTYDSPAYGFLNQTATGMSLDNIGRLTFYKAGVPMLAISDNDIIFRDGKGINTGSTSGTKFGLDPSQKLAFYGTTPVTRPTGTPPVATDAATTQTLVNSLRTSLINLGLIG